MSRKLETDALTIQLLQACQDLVARQNEFLPYLADEFQVRPSELLYLWAGRKIEQYGKLAEGWVYFFHGWECDLKNEDDGRFLRVDFGPGGRLDTFTAWGVLQFIMCSKQPWIEYAELQMLVAKEPPPFTQYSGSFEKWLPFWDSLEEQKLLQVADIELLEWADKFTSLDEQGITQIKFPAHIPDKTIIDSSLANRQMISQIGSALLQTVK
jgi:hypothetical protein